MKMTGHRQVGRTVLWTLLACGLLAMPAAGQAGAEIPLGTAMPMADASLARAQGGQATLSSLAGQQGTAVIFWSNQCPWVERAEGRMMDLAETYSGQGISFVLINSNDAEAYPQESAAESASRMDAGGYPSDVAYISDPTSQVARAFGAERTPHVYLFDANGVLAYVGTIDDSPGDPANVQEQYLRSALEAVAGGSNVAVPQTKAFGCTIKFNG